MKLKELIGKAAQVMSLTLRKPKEARYLIEASRLLKEAMDKADEAHKQSGWRYYIVWDSALKELVPLTYEHHKGHWDSYKYLRQRGRFKSYYTPFEFKTLSFYYTPSRWKPGCPEAERKEKMVDWQRYYVRQMMKRDRLCNIQQDSAQEDKGKAEK
jgi:hypothetical protein